MTQEMKEQTLPTLRFLCKEHPNLGFSSTTEHVTADGKTALCGSKDGGEPRDAADWDALHSPRFHRRCPKCQQAAVLLLRPRAKFWYLDPFHGAVKEFVSLASAVRSARKEHGNSTIHQTGPGETNRIVKSVEGLDPLP